MRKILFILCLLLTQHGFAQNAALQLTSMNVVYIGLKNPFKVAGSGLTAENLVYQTQNCEVDMLGPFGTIQPTGEGRECKVIIGKVLKLDTFWIDTFDFRVKGVPEPIICLGAIQGSERTSIGRLMAQSKVYCYISNFPYTGIRYSVDSFTMIFAGKDTIIYNKIARSKIAKSWGDYDTYLNFCGSSLHALGESAIMKFYRTNLSLINYEGAVVVNNAFFSGSDSISKKTSSTIFTTLENSNIDSIPHYFKVRTDIQKPSLKMRKYKSSSISQFILEKGKTYAFYGYSGDFLFEQKF